jgi:hypothetical protein
MQWIDAPASMRLPLRAGFERALARRAFLIRGAWGSTVATHQIFQNLSAQLRAKAVGETLKPRPAWQSSHALVL